MKSLSASPARYSRNCQTHLNFPCSEPNELFCLTLSFPSSKSTFSQPFKRKYMSAVVRICSIIFLYWSEWIWKAKFSLLCNVIFLARLQSQEVDRITFSLPRVITFKFPLQPPKNRTSCCIENLAFHSLLRWKMIILSILTTSLVYFPFWKVGRMYLFLPWDWKGLSVWVTHRSAENVQNTAKVFIAQTERTGLTIRHSVYSWQPHMH